MITVLPMIAAGLTAGILLGRASSVLWPLFPALLLGTGACFVLPKGKRLPATAALACAVGFLLGQTAYHPVLPPQDTYIVTGVICDEVQVDPVTGRLRTRLTDVTLSGGERVAGAYWTCYPAEDIPPMLRPGMQVSMTAAVYHPSGADNPGGFNFREYLFSQGMTAGVYGCSELTISAPAHFSLLGTAAAVRHSLSASMIDVMGQRAGGYAAAMLLGTKSLLQADELAAFSELGFSHILSVSGFHVGVLAGILLLLLRRCGRRCQNIVLLTALLLYCLLTGGHTPVVRASVLLAAARLRPKGRRSDSRWLLMTAYVVTLLLNPTQLTSASMQLTYGAVLGLVVLAPALQRGREPHNRFAGWLWKGLCASLAVQAGLLLPQLYWFHQLPLLSLLLNPFMIAAGGLLITLMWAVLALCAIPVLGPAVGMAAAAAVNLWADGIVWLNGQGIFSLWTGQANWLTTIGWTAALIGVGGLLRSARRSRQLALVGCAALLISLVPMPHQGTEYIQFSVSNADSALLWDENTVTVIDTGEMDDSALATYLHQHRLSIDSLILTHLHRDHVGGVRQLLDDRIPVKTLYLPCDADHTAVDPEVLALVEELRGTGTAVRELSRGDELSLPSGAMTVLWPEKGRVRSGSDANLYSLNMLVKVHNTVMLLTGDMDGRYEAYTAHPADILKVAHHGSQSSSSPEYLASVSPDAAILSCGDARRADSMAERLNGVPLYVTRNNGAVTIRFSSDEYEISTVK